MLVFRTLTYVLPIPLGLGTWLFWRRNRSWRRGPEVSGFGFVSGHATVATVVVAILLPYVRRRVGWVLIGLALLVGLIRVYVGAHLPLDVVGGAALAVLVAAGVHLGLGRPPSRGEDLS